jgi:adenylate cyclase
VRKLPGKKFCIGGPSQQAQIKLNAMLQPGQNRFVKVALEAGNYRFYCDKSRVSVHAVVKEGGLESALLTFSNDDRRVQFVELSPNPNLILQNRFSEPIIIKCENTDWENYSISASEVTSWPIFRDLFPRELIRPKKQLPANNLTILFTDLFNSSELYNTNGDDSAVGLVMNHFDILQEVIEEERGSIVKTIGDAVMAVFPKPIYAVKAFHHAQHIFKNELRTERPILLKAGIHTGNCVAVTLNNHIDYFGNTVNIASRLVEYARGEEVVISSDAYECTELREFLSSKRDKLKIHHFDASLKGFESHTFEAKRISMQNNHLRLVV